jgi:hypothetical protein
VRSASRNTSRRIAPSSHLTVSPRKLTVGIRAGWTAPWIVLGDGVTRTPRRPARTNPTRRTVRTARWC